MEELSLIATGLTQLSERMTELEYLQVLDVSYNPLKNVFDTMGLYNRKYFASNSSFVLCYLVYICQTSHTTTLLFKVHS